MSIGSERMNLFLTGVIESNPNRIKEFEKAYDLLVDNVDCFLFCPVGNYYDEIPGRLEGQDYYSHKQRLAELIKNDLLKYDGLAVIDTPFGSKELDVEIKVAKALGIKVAKVDEWVQFAKDMDKVVSDFLNGEHGL